MHLKLKIYLSKYKNDFEFLKILLQKHSKERYQIIWKHLKLKIYVSKYENYFEFLNILFQKTLKV